MPDVSDFPQPPINLDLRLVWYFTVVAEHQHFGHAADALHMAQPSLSRQIQRLEKELGAQLFDRTPHGSHLTEAGEVFLPHAEALLHAAQQAAAHARAAAQPGTITIGYQANIVVTSAVRALRHQVPEAVVRTLHLDWNEVPVALLDHRVDAAVGRPPFLRDQLDVTVLYNEPRVIVVPTFHRLAGRESVTLDDFADERLPRFPDVAWNAFWRIDPRPDGRPAPEGPLVETIEDKLELIAAGQAIAIAPAGTQNSIFRQDLTTVPIEGIEPCQVVLAIRENERSRLITAFREAAQVHLSGAPGAAPGEL